jgi:hypothetical protein
MVTRKWGSPSPGVKPNPSTLLSCVSITAAPPRDSIPSLRLPPSLEAAVRARSAARLRPGLYPKIRKPLTDYKFRGKQYI